MNRRHFLQSALLVGSAGVLPAARAATLSANADYRPGMITTWDHGRIATKVGNPMLEAGRRALDIVEQGVVAVEDDPSVTSVGYGGLPDETGVVSLDACIMDGVGHRAGAVAFLQNIKNPIAVARKVMETTRHVLLAGDGALRFARQNGFKEQDLLTDAARERWLQWKRSLNPDDNWLEPTHDTVTMLCLDRAGNLAGACSTSGLAMKIHGRVGDSPIIGAGLYVDNAVGAAGATGVGELVLRSLASFTVVEFMRQGLPPGEACRAAFERMCEKIPEARHTQEALIAINKKGEVGSATNTAAFTFYYGDGERAEHVKPTPIG
jgi:isoaspartyl peptidase/L-asparaginase-like protein (Ntn-hydrolase superfamily)